MHCVRPILKLENQTVEICLGYRLYQEPSPSIVFVAKVTSGATSNTSAVTVSLFFLPSVAPCSQILKSLTSATRNLSPHVAIAIFAIITTVEHFNVNTVAVFLLLSNIPRGRTQKTWTK